MAALRRSVYWASRRSLRFWRIEFRCSALENWCWERARLAIARADGALTSLGELNPSLDGIAETRWLDFHYSNAEGSRRPQLSGCLLLPPDYRSGHRYPLIVEVYPDRPGDCAAPQVRHRFAMGAHPTPYSEHLWPPEVSLYFGRIPEAVSAARPPVRRRHCRIVDRGVDAVLAAGSVIRTGSA